MIGSSIASRQVSIRLIIFNFPCWRGGIDAQDLQPVHTIAKHVTLWTIYEIQHAYAVQRDVTVGLQANRVDASPHRIVCAVSQALKGSTFSKSSKT